MCHQEEEYGMEGGKPPEIEEDFSDDDEDGDPFLVDYDQRSAPPLPPSLSSAGNSAALPSSQQHKRLRDTNFEDSLADDLLDNPPLNAVSSSAPPPPPPPPPPADLEATTTNNNNNNGAAVSTLHTTTIDLHYDMSPHTATAAIRCSGSSSSGSSCSSRSGSTSHPPDNHKNKDQPDDAAAAFGLSLYVDPRLMDAPALQHVVKGYQQYIKAMMGGDKTRKKVRRREEEEEGLPTFKACGCMRMNGSRGSNRIITIVSTTNCYFTTITNAILLLLLLQL